MSHYPSFITEQIDQLKQDKKNGVKAPNKFEFKTESEAISFKLSCFTDTFLNADTEKEEDEIIEKYCSDVETELMATREFLLLSFLSNVKRLKAIHEQRDSVEIPEDDLNDTDSEENKVLKELEEEEDILVKSNYLYVTKIDNICRRIYDKKIILDKEALESEKKDAKTTETICIGGVTENGETHLIEQIEH